MVRVVVLDRERGESFTEDIGEDNAVAIYVPGKLRARLRGADATASFSTTSPRSTTPPIPTSTGFAWDDERVKHLWSTERPILSERDYAACS